MRWPAGERPRGRRGGRHARKLNVLQVCDHLGWEGSRMHGVKRLFAWMIPRFDRDRYNVSLVSLRKKDLSEETLDSFGVDITYLHKSKFDPATLPALLKVIDRKQIDILHLHGYGATTFGRLAGGMRRIPTILHEHANLTDTPWFQKVADTCLEPLTDIAIAVSESTAEFVDQGTQDPGREGEDRLSRRAARGVQPLPEPRRDRCGPGRARHRARRVRGRHGHAAARVEGQLLSRRRGPAGHQRSAAGEVLHRRRGAAARAARAAGARARPRRSLRVRRLRPRRRARRLGVRRQRVSLALGRARR